jgi:hypothetical protein
VGSNLVGLAEFSLASPEMNLMSPNSFYQSGKAGGRPDFPGDDRQGLCPNGFHSNRVGDDPVIDGGY